MRRVEFSRAALDDLDTIYTDTVTSFDQAQANRYADMLDAALRMIAEYPMAGAPVAARSNGLRRRNAGAHAVFYLADTDSTRIVRVLHQRMDPDLHL